MAASIREKYDGQLAPRLDVRVLVRLLSCSTTIEKRLRRRFVDQFNTTLPRFDVLATLERFPDGISMGDLSGFLLVSNGNVTVLVRQLEADGFVRSEVAENDKRRSIVMMTPQGREHFKMLVAAHNDWIGGMFEGMPESDLKQLFALLAKLKSSIGAEKGASL